MHVIYSPSLISYAFHCTNAPMQRFQHALAYFAAVLSNAHKMFIKLTIVVDLINSLFM
jgi:hypothetical protein